MSRPDAAMIDKLTAGAEKWLRRCNGFPREGIPVLREHLRTVLLASDDVHRDEKGRIAWRAGGPMSTGRTFTAEAVPPEAPSAASPLLTPQPPG